ncbi:hypothetical protein FHS57_006186 [Runella defluvii]|uniref:Secretion system C-terminal sorting domain-containing protein n=1 Tax=Runella defluvii TaxID=370973 RepID=A0A7W5ZSY6_9BACT|nr:T9SS type A sorting domain-containing protein [Runella defluvii]MBB3842155.1 hypothetical protein [Runella defluvii]
MKLHYLFTRLKHLKITYLTSLFLVLGLGASQPLLAQTKLWAGDAGTNDWNNASNWSPVGVPTATNDVIITTVSSPLLYPTISTTDAKAKSVFIVSSSAALTIANTGKLTINGFNNTTNTSFTNSGIFENSGQLVLGNESALYTYGIKNNGIGTIKNNAGATIAVDNTSNIAIDNSGTFTNAGTVNVGQTQSVGSAGLNNLGSFENKTGGVFKIDRCVLRAMEVNETATFVNAGTINIGVGGSVGSVGITSKGSFDNNLGGVITIDNFSNYGIEHVVGTFRNYATIIIGATAGGAFGLGNGATFINDGCSALLSVQSNSRIFSGSGATTSNSGTIIEKASGNSNITANTGLIQNLNGGTFNVGAGPLPVLVAVGAPPTTFNGGDGSIKIKGLLNDTYELTYSKDGGSPTTNSVAVTTNEITIPSLGVGTYAITVKGTTCSTLEFSLSTMVENPTLTLGVAVVPTTCTGTGSIAFTSTVYSGTTQTLSYSYQANGNATAETRTASVTIESNGTFTLNNLPIGIYSQFAIGGISATGSRVINVLANETTLIWTGCANGEWHNAANWSNLTVPAATEDVKIGVVSSPQLYPTISTTDAKAKSVIIFSSATLTITNSGKLTINGFRNNLSFDNNGTFENNGQLVLGNENALGSTGIANRGTFNNNAGATITVDYTSNTAINNDPNATFSNAGTVNVGQTQSVGANGIACAGGTFENKTGGVIKISRCTNAALIVSPGITFTNAGTINVGNVGGILLFGIYNLGNFDNNVGGEITVDNFPFNGVGIENSASGVFRNYASIIVGGIAASVNSRALNNGGTFSNVGCGSLLWIKSNSIITGTGTTNNAGMIIENATGTSTITANTGLVQNLNGGTFTITQSATSVPVFTPLGIAPSNCPTNNNGSVLLLVEPNTEYAVTLGVGGTPQNLTSNASGQLSMGGNLSIGTYTITLKKACWLQAITSTVTVSEAALTNGISANQSGANCTIKGRIEFATNLGFTGTSSTYPVTYKRNGVNQSGQLVVTSKGGVISELTEGTYSDFKVLEYGTCEVVNAGIIYVAGIVSPATITSPTTCAGTDGSVLFNVGINPGTYSLSYKKNGTTVTIDVTVVQVGRARRFNLSNLSAGIYSDFVLTADCALSYSPVIRLGDLPNPAVSGTTAVTTVGGSDGSIQLSGLAVSKSYSISYQKDGGTAVTTTASSNADGNLTLANLGGGSYTNIILTISGCSSSALSATVSAPASAFTFAYSSTVPPSGCGAMDGALVFTTTLPVGTNAYTLDYTFLGSPGVATISVTAGSGGNNTFTLSGLRAGAYRDFKIVHNSTDITITDILTVSNPNKPTFAVGTKTPPSGCTTTDGSIQLTGLAASTSYSVSYQKDGGTAVTATVGSDASGSLVISSLGAGAYTNIKVTLNNCISDAATATLSAPTFTLTQTGISNPTTCGATDGTLSFSTSLPAGNYTLSYKKGSDALSTLITVGTSRGRVSAVGNTVVLPELGAGTYSDFKITYTGCEVTLAGPYSLSDPNKPTFAVGAKTPPSGCNTTDGSIQLTGLAASTSYSVSYQKDGGMAVTATVGSDASGSLVMGSLGAGAYTNIKVTLNNCISDAATATLSAPTFTLTQTGSSHPTTCGATDGTLSFSTSLPAGNYTLSYKKGSDALSTLITVGTSRGRVSAVGNTFVLPELGAGTYSDFKITYKGCDVTLAGPYTLNAPSSVTASIAGSTTVCQNAASATITFTGANGTGVYTFGYRINGGPLQSVSSASGANTATVTQPTTTAGVFVYDLVSVSAANCSQAQTGNATVKVQGKPTVTLTTLQRTLVEGNSQTLCDTDANPVNGLQFTVSGLCVVGNPVWRVQVGNGVWSDWSATAPVSQSSNNQPHRYQAACDATCPATYTGPIELTITGRASVPQNVSLLVDGVTVAVGETKEVCSLVNTTLTFNANCAGGEVVLYSVDGGEYSAAVPTALVDNQFHNYRVRCRQSNGAPSCVESESGVMRLKLVVIPSAPTVSLSSTSSCNPSASFSGQSSCGSLRTVWYNASTNVALPSLPSTVPSQTTSYYARCQTENGCVSEKSNVVTFTLTSGQAAPVITASQEIVCTGTTVTITANCPAGSTTSWNTGVTTPSFEVAFSNVIKQTYWAKCLFEGGCQSAESARKDIYWNAFTVTLINIGESKSAIKTNDRSAWTSQFITRDGGPELEQSTQVNPTLFYVENANKMAPRYWTIHADACGLGTNGSLTFDMQAVPEMGVIRSFNTHENNAPYFMYANREGWTELYAQNHPAYGFYQDNGAGGNSYDAGLPKGLYKLGIRYWDMKGWGSIFPSTRKPQGNVLAYQEYWFRIQSKDGIGVGAARTAESEEAKSKGQGANGKGQEAKSKGQGARGEEQGSDNGQQLTDNGAFATVLPNPVSNILRLKIQESKGQVVQTVLTDASGRQVMGRKFVPETNTHQEEFGVSELPAGMYFLQVTTADQQATLKVLKMN